MAKGRPGPTRLAHDAPLAPPFWPKDDTWRMLNEETERTEVAGGAVAWPISDRGVRPRG